MFDEILQIIEANGKSVHAYREATRFARGKAAATRQDAAAYLLLALEAEQFLDLNERMPMRTNDVEQAFERMRAHVDRLNAGYRSGDPAERLAAIETIAREIAGHDA